MRRAYRYLVPFVAIATLACGGERDPGEIEGAARPTEDVAAAAAAQDAARTALDRRTARPVAPKRVLFGDLHVHTTYSIDAFAFSLPLFSGEGAHPPADACDFARYCSQLDFFSLNDHAEGLTPERWQATKESLRQCNALAGEPADPDLVAFTGWEWTQVGLTPETHFGHKNVIFPGTADAELPARPITSLENDGDMGLFRGAEQLPRARWIDPLGWGEYSDFGWLLDRLGEIPNCPPGVDTRELPADCRENAPTPDILFEKLSQWGFDTLVIPHGTSWGLYTPPTTAMDKQLTGAYHDPEKQALIEIFSGHGNSEEYRDYAPFRVRADGSKICPAPTADYLPCCWRAGEIMRERCGDLPADECEARAQAAMQLAMDAGISPHLTFPDTRAEDWLDCGNCRDCFKPALKLRPRESVQYSMALSNFEETGSDGDPLRFRYGFISSSDNHTARPGTGYKQVLRKKMTDATGARSAFYNDFARRQAESLQEDPQMPQAPPAFGETGLIGADVERATSFLYPGGLVAVHSEGRSRESIWAAMKRREVYGTSGPRILLWFELLNGPQGTVPMGGAATLGETPRFEVRAVGAFRQEPGCPESSLTAFSGDRLAQLCGGECYHPGDERHTITTIEIVRIRPQARPDEEAGRLIDDPWRRFDCAPDPNGCIVQFEDPEYASSGRDVLYYARVLQEPTPAITAANLRTEFDADGNAVSVDPCFGDFRTPSDDDCLAPVQERAWSSPIFLDQP